MKEQMRNDIEDAIRTGFYQVKGKAFVSPTHKRTEGRAPVWGSEFTSKRRRTTRGDPVETAARLNVKLRTSVTGAWWWCFFLTAY